MARRRVIDPSFWDDLTIAGLSLPARLCFLGMISNADDEGRIEADPRYIKRAVFGFDEAVSYPDVAEFLSEIERHCPNLQFYEVAGRLMASFRNWKRYQYIQKPQKSRLPAPPEARSDEYDTSTLPITERYDSQPLSVADEHHSGNGRVSPNRIEVNRIEENKKRAAAAAIPTRTHAIIDTPDQDQDKHEDPAPVRAKILKMRDDVMGGSDRE